jgi:Flp pilus assembly pilin Flp
VRHQLRDLPLYGTVVASLHVESGLRRLRSALLRLRGNEKGQTPTEYLMIVGLMAAAIVTIFVTFFWTNIRDAASSWSEKVRDAVTGTAMQ